MVIILGIVLVVVVLFGTAFALVLLMDQNNGTQMVANGDYIRYSVTYYGNSDPVQGYVNMSVSNVKLSGYDITIEYTGFDIPTETKHFNGIGVLATLDGLGDTQTDNPTHQISTVYGEKSVDVYYKFQNNEGWTSFAGANPLVQYRMDVSGYGYSIQFLLDSTNIEEVQTGNAV